MNESLEQARILLLRAGDDAFMMRRLLEHPESPYWGIGFHAQQAAEKAIKAVLAAHQVVFPFTHDLKLLLNLLKRNNISPPPEQNEITALIPYGALLRYDEVLDDNEAKELNPQRLSRVIQEVLEWADKLVDKGDPHV